MKPPRERARVALVAFVLAHAFVGESSAPKLALLLHGVLGAGNNLRSLAASIVKERPDYRVCLVDLRHHGASQGAAPPNTLRACAEDLQALVEDIGKHPIAVLGHSFGGKVALQYSSFGPPSLHQVWLLDSNPGPQDPDANQEVLRVLASARSLAGPFRSRQAAVAALQAKGLSSGTANWLATSLRLDDAACYRWIFDFDAIAELLSDYSRSDLWPVLEAAVAPLGYYVVLAERSDRWSPAARQRLEKLAGLGRLKIDTVPEAGHWLHVDNPNYLRALITRELE